MLYFSSRTCSLNYISTSISTVNIKSSSFPLPSSSRFECRGPKTTMSSKMQSSSSIAQARRTVQQLRREACIERIKVPCSSQSFTRHSRCPSLVCGLISLQVSKASSDLVRYCGEHAKSDPLLMGIPASENPFKDKKPCTVL